MKQITTKELFKRALSKAKLEQGTSTKLVEISRQAGSKWSVKIAFYNEGIFEKHLIIEL